MAASLIRIGAVCNKTALSRSTIYTLIASGQFPRSVRLTQRRVAWLSTDIDQWILNRSQS